MNVDRVLQWSAVLVVGGCVTVGVTALIMHEPAHTQFKGRVDVGLAETIGLVSPYNAAYNWYVVKNLMPSQEDIDLHLGRFAKDKEVKGNWKPPVPISQPAKKVGPGPVITPTPYAAPPPLPPVVMPGPLPPSCYQPCNTPQMQASPR